MEAAIAFARAVLQEGRREGAPHAARWRELLAAEDARDWQRVDSVRAPMLPEAGAGEGAAAAVAAGEAGAAAAEGGAGEAGAAAAGQAAGEAGAAASAGRAPGEGHDAARGMTAVAGEMLADATAVLGWLLGGVLALGRPTAALAPLFRAIQPATAALAPAGAVVRDGWRDGTAAAARAIALQREALAAVGVGDWRRAGPALTGACFEALSAAFCAARTSMLAAPAMWQGVSAAVRGGVGQAAGRAFAAAGQAWDAVRSSVAANDGPAEALATAAAGAFEGARLVWRGSGDACAAARRAVGEAKAAACRSIAGGTVLADAAGGLDWLLGDVLPLDRLAAAAAPLLRAALDPEDAQAAEAAAAGASAAWQALASGLQVAPASSALVAAAAAVCRARPGRLLWRAASGSMQRACRQLGLEWAVAADALAELSAGPGPLAGGGAVFRSCRALLRAAASLAFGVPLAGAYAAVDAGRGLWDVACRLCTAAARPDPRLTALARRNTRTRSGRQQLVRERVRRRSRASRHGLQLGAQLLRTLCGIPARVLRRLAREPAARDAVAAAWRDLPVPARTWFRDRRAGGDAPLQRAGRRRPPPARRAKLPPPPCRPRGIVSRGWRTLPCLPRRARDAPAPPLPRARLSDTWHRVRREAARVFGQWQGAAVAVARACFPSPVQQQGQAQQQQQQEPPRPSPQQQQRQEQGQEQQQEPPRPPPVAPAGDAGWPATPPLQPSPSPPPQQQQHQQQQQGQVQEQKREQKQAQQQQEWVEVPGRSRAPAAPSRAPAPAPAAAGRADHGAPGRRRPHLQGGAAGARAAA
ncbi:hypothetical protein Rsub_12494 [Raphidocelis subcapitata]|uniref:Uncharacterized protein n=1 Tax=Raphidocelis subcapitata TaxID=307507 RepID=A0A2V0PJ66_9CHLO|nr:hypothetical protein Rsub_12494 [Raphidocelis subcapitata]|eukprot:GBF99854.1 hypothetical protein Rsub_12494 [Raphidocelis subcapitata]